MGHDENGSATVTAALTVAGLAALLIAILAVGSAVAARHRAQHSADLSALAAAQVRLLADGDPCAQARALAERQEGTPRVTRCEVLGRDVLVTVQVRVRLGRWGIRDATAQARAGP
ncbi:MAG: flp pilus-assembly TadE/G-like family protein [Gordonia sp. (in: high G+C Gram-positive bacteria)]|uniref:Rv3654c family TadE-like protein n=1 Tax=Gordonia sp. (in: high G+C Gram-positive bacteria) TaxID=84139 RepID=UPI0039E6AADD